MKLNRCPICRCHIDIFALAKDEATSQLLAKLATMDSQFGYALMNYLSLFSPEKSGLTAERSLRLIDEIEQLADGDTPRMALAMAATAQIQYDKRQNGVVVKQFTTHNYLKKVFEQTPAQPRAVAPLAGQGAKSPALTRGLAQTAPQTATGNALAELEAMKHE